MFEEIFRSITKNYTDTLNNFKEKLQRNLEGILEIFAAFLKICQGRYKA